MVNCSGASNSFGASQQYQSGRIVHRSSSSRTISTGTYSKCSLGDTGRTHTLWLRSVAHTHTLWLRPSCHRQLLQAAVWHTDIMFRAPAKFRASLTSIKLSARRAPGVKGFDVRHLSALNGTKYVMFTIFYPLFFTKIIQSASAIYAEEMYLAWQKDPSRYIADFRLS